MVFPGLQNRQRDLQSPTLAKITTELGGETTLCFRSFLIFAETAVLLNAVDEEQGLSPPDAVFQGLQNRQRDLLQPTLTKFSTALGSVTILLFC